MSGSSDSLLRCSKRIDAKNRSTDSVIGSKHFCAPKGIRTHIKERDSQSKPTQMGNCVDPTGVGIQILAGYAGCPHADWFWCSVLKSRDYRGYYDFFFFKTHQPLLLQTPQRVIIDTVYDLVYNKSNNPVYEYEYKNNGLTRVHLLDFVSSLARHILPPLSDAVLLAWAFQNHITM